MGGGGGGMGHTSSPKENLKTSEIDSGVFWEA